MGFGPVHHAEYTFCSDGGFSAWFKHRDGYFSTLNVNISLGT